MSEKLRIGQFLPFASDHWHSIERFSHLLRLGLATSPHEFDVMAVRPKESWKKWGNMIGRRGLYTLLAGHQDFNLFHIVDQSYSHLIWGFPAEKTLITCHDLEFWRHQNWRNKVVRLWIARSLCRARVVVTPSQVIANEVRELALAIGSKVPTLHVVHNSYGEEFVRPTLEKRTEGPFHLLHIGNSHWERKNFAFLLRVAAKVFQEEKNFRFFHVGPPLLTHHQQLVDTLGAANFFVHRSNLSASEVVALYQQADLYVHPSTYEGFGYPLLETLACGTPFLASDIPVFRELFPVDSALVPLSEETWVQRVLELVRSNEKRQALLEMETQLLSQYSQKRQIASYAEIIHEHFAD